jgi:hypothetical protein
VLHHVAILVFSFASSLRTKRQVSREQTTPALSLRGGSVKRACLRRRRPGAGYARMRDRPRELRLRDELTYLWFAQFSDDARDGRQ